MIVSLSFINVNFLPCHWPTWRFQKMLNLLLSLFEKRNYRRYGGVANSPAPYDRLLIGVKEPKNPNKSYLNFTLDDLEMIMNITDTNGGPLESTSRTLHQRLTTVTVTTRSS